EAGPVWDKDKVLIGEILEVNRHPDADRLTLPVVAYGEGRTKTLVTGAPNIKVGEKGQKVVVALCGSVLFDGHAEQKVLKELKPTKIRGVPSDAMVCSFKELGISDEHEGIIILEEDAPVGMPLADFMGDIVLELEVTPNLARCLSMIGVAREVSAITGQPLKPPDTRSLQQGEAITGQVSVLIENSMSSARYAAALIKGVKIGPAPGWMQRRLTYAGMRPINNIVDITNYVMLEWGQPLHAFDYDLLVQRAEGRAPVITVRPARAGEILVTLDGQKRELSGDNLVIADVRGPIALAGVMGGADTEVGEKTRNILLESASFDFVSIRRTMKQFNLPSEASVRFSKGIHPETVLPAATRAAALMAQHAGGTVCKGLVDTYPAPLPPQVVRLEMKEVNRVLGMDFPAADALRILRALEYQVKEVGPGVLEAIVPPHRLDVQAGSADVIEDLVRIHGYDHLPATLLADRLPKQQTNQPLVFEEHLRDMLAGSGLQEVIAYSLTTPEREAPFGQPGEYVRLLNPISSDRVVMRRMLLPGMLEVAAANLRHTDDVRLFEIGPVYLPRANEKLPDEPRRLALVLIGKRRREFWGDAPGSTAAAETLDFFDIKGIVEALAADLHLAQVSYEPRPTSFLHPGQAAKLVLSNKQTAGVFGLMHPKTAAAIGLGERTVLVGEFDVDALQAAVPGRYTYDAVPRFPHALRDIAVIVDEGITADRLKAEILTAGGNLLREVRLFDLYKGGSIPPGTKSLAYALTYQAEDRTLTDKEVDKAHKKIEDRLKHVLHAQIRGKV
ncbi:MAG TPA: phenylalanine--tRNA ligase subunit beta, partial [Gemmataceae bacterium]|nr:phenylalanine--tRNA ligase subunit beta [Gemmataceae bacterium]